LYKTWLHLMCKWAVIGLDGEEYKKFDELTTKLNKHCQECEEGYICFHCNDTGIAFSFEESNIYNNLEKAIDKRRDNVVS
jgi:hypothetical protein